jgi:ubiquitin carboxyl-terminal hydrolase 8
MPIVAVSPSSPPTPSSQSTHSCRHPCILAHRPNVDPHNRPAIQMDNLSVAEIKEQAKQQVQRGIRGATTLSLIRSAKGQISLAQSREDAGDLKGALSAFTKAASLTRVFMDSAEFKAENAPGRRGVLWKEFTEFQQVSGTPYSRPPSTFLMPFSERATTLRSVRMPLRANWFKSKDPLPRSESASRL